MVAIAIANENRAVDFSFLTRARVPASIGSSPTRVERHVDDTRDVARRQCELPSRDARCFKVPMRSARSSFVATSACASDFGACDNFKAKMKIVSPLGEFSAATTRCRQFRQGLGT